MAPAVCREESKPGRSEEGAGDAEQQERMAALVRQKFAEEAPQRPLKPSRSEDVSHDSANPLLHGPIPEYLKLQSLVQGSPSQLIVQEYSTEAPDEFVETQYYKDLYAVDKNLHHTTGSGFIQVESNGPATYHSLPDAPVGAQISVSQLSMAVDTPEEFVETEYYKDLNAVDKTQHHTTGSGFIQVESAVHVESTVPTTLHDRSAGLARTKSGCNPATNDWIPAPNAPDTEVSNKPNRSEL